MRHFMLSGRRWVSPFLFSFVLFGSCFAWKYPDKRKGCECTGDLACKGRVDTFMGGLVCSRNSGNTVVGQKLK